ncbi:serine hydrolase domain-containing protein [Halogranum rubrum]|uniref:serine hydrolase domain-containing protein n=1 Tax=Halogranum rubrum TaxID=553466 RepID=UPI001FE09053|nr:serine hydrolase domain-containing protein [Halogranum rubrum]
MLLVVILTLVCAPIAAATTVTSAPVTTPTQVELSNQAATEAWLDETMADQLEQHHIPGAAVVIVTEGEVVLAKGYGYADIESETPVVADETIFRVGSTSKLVTWTAVMQGVEDGRLNLDTDVNDYLGESPVMIPETYPQSITLEHLGTHTAGFEDSYGGMLVDDPQDLQPLGETLAENRPARVRPPGEFVAYSNYGAALAGHIVAEEYDTSFTGYANEHVLEPLEMQNSTFEQPVPPELSSRVATGYSYQDGAYQPQEFEYFGMAPEGSMSATATDMGHFMLAHLNGGQYESVRILDEATVEEMHRQHFSNVPGVPEQSGMAYGFIEMNRNDERIIGHWGTTAQFMSLLALYPERDVGIFVAYNSPGGAEARFELLDAFSNRYYPDDDAPVVEPPAGAAERTSNFTGDYRTIALSETKWHKLLGLTSTISVEATDEGYLTTQMFGGESRRWVEVRPAVYEEVGGDDYLTFRVDESGRGTHLFFGSIGSRTYERLSWFESLLVTQAILLGGVLAFVMTLVLWLGRSLWRRMQNQSPPERGARVSTALLGTTSLVWMTVSAIFLLTLLNFNDEVASPSLLLLLGQVFTFIGLLATGGSAVATVVVWREAYWGLRRRFAYSLAVVVALLFTWQLYYWQVIPL